MSKAQTKTKRKLEVSDFKRYVDLNEVSSDDNDEEEAIKVKKDMDKMIHRHSILQYAFHDSSSEDEVQTKDAGIASDFGESSGSIHFNIADEDSNFVSRNHKHKPITDVDDMWVLVDGQGDVNVGVVLKVFQDLCLVRVKCLGKLYGVNCLQKFHNVKLWARYPLDKLYFCPVTPQEIDIVNGIYLVGLRYWLDGL